MEMKKLLSIVNDGSTQKQLDEFDINLRQPYGPEFNKGFGADISGSPEVQEIIKKMQPADWVETNKFVKEFPNKEAYAKVSSGDYLSVWMGRRHQDMYNFVQRYNRDNNNLSIAQWLEKAKNKISSAVTGKPEQPVSYRAARYDKEAGADTHKDEKAFPTNEMSISQYMKAVNNEVLQTIKEEQAQKKVEVKRVVDKVLSKMNEGKTQKQEAPKPRNFVAKNQQTSGAGAHKDKKKAAKQGDVKHKGKEMELAEMHRRDAYQRDYDSSVSGFGRRNREDDWDEGNTEPPNNFAITINGKKWKVFQGNGYYADDQREMAQYRKLQDMCRRKTEQTGKKWEVYRTGESPTNENTQLNEKAVSKAQQRFMGMVHAAQKGDKAASPEVAKVAKGMGKKDAKDFAATKHKGLPEKKKKDVKEGLKDPKDNPCWKGYKPVGTKKKAGKTVPNCVPKESIEVGSPVKVYSNVLKKTVFGKVVELKENRAYVQYNNTKIVMGHPLNEVAAAAAAPVAAAAGKSFLKRALPGVGLAFSGYDAWDRFKKGDYTGAALSAGAGLTSLVPVVGTAASMGLTGAQLARDYKMKTGAFAPGEEEQPAQAAAATAPKATAPGQAATPATSKDKNLSKGKAVATGAQAGAATPPKISDPVGLQKALMAAGANLGPTGADGKIGKFTSAAMADPKYASIVKQFSQPSQAATPAPSQGSRTAAAVRTVAPAAASVAGQMLK